MLCYVVSHEVQLHNILASGIFIGIFFIVLLSFFLSFYCNGRRTLKKKRKKIIFRKYGDTQHTYHMPEPVPVPVPMPVSSKCICDEICFYFIVLNIVSISGLKHVKLTIVYKIDRLFLSNENCLQVTRIR